MNDRSLHRPSQSQGVEQDYLPATPARCVALRSGFSEIVDRYIPARTSTPPTKVDLAGTWPKIRNARIDAPRGSPRNARETTDAGTYRKAQFKTVWPRIVGTTANSAKYSHSPPPYE